MRRSAEGRWWRRWRGGGAGRPLLRGPAQVMFLADARTGAVFCLALATADWRYTAYALGGAALGTGTARLLRVAPGRVESGLEGFNACLLALCLAVFLGAGRPSTMLLATAGCVVTAVATAAVVRLLRVWQLPPLTLPYCLLATAVTVAAPAFRRIRPYDGSLAALPRAASGATALSPADLGRAFFRNVSQVFFLDEWYAGALLLAGLFLAGRTAGLMACAGSATGILTAWTLGAPAARIADGTLGCNAVLVAVALCGVFLAAAPVTAGYALLGAATATTVTPAVAHLLAPSGGHPFTWPFVLTTLGFLAAARSFPRLTGPAPAADEAPPPPAGAPAPAA
ncbi:urea transporter [Streptomyces naphthomycinicus]|uniref:urea transporter n=1 Tax=Streptomyces naphthomycinicus TaxID=2872625 RepID=UPI001CEC2877|nr:urea transporter [Streptomyces sp. TML10]